MVNSGKSKLALWVSGVYFVFAFGAWLLPLIAKPGEDLAGVFLILFAQPWVILWSSVTQQLQLDSMALTMLALLAGILVNTWVIYRLFCWLSRR